MLQRQGKRLDAGGGNRWLVSERPRFLVRRRSRKIRKSVQPFLLIAGRLVGGHLGRHSVEEPDGKSGKKEKHAAPPPPPLCLP
jgi:hypothetical protein